jgi:two-component sensor histidine kinase
MNVEKVDLNLDQAIPCGLIVNELLTNAVKYAFTDQDKNNVISIKVTEKKGIVEITVADNGLGLPKNFDVNKTNTLGLQLVSTLTEQLEGKLTVMNDNGAKFIITFKKI